MPSEPKPLNNDDPAPAIHAPNVLAAPQAVDPRDAQIAELQEQLAQQKDWNNEERMIWVLLFLIMVMVGVAVWTGTNAAAIVLGMLIFVFVIVLSKRWGVESVTMTVDRIISQKWSNSK